MLPLSVVFFPDTSVCLNLETHVILQRKSIPGNVAPERGLFFRHVCMFKTRKYMSSSSENVYQFNGGLRGGV